MPPETPGSMGLDAPSRPDDDWPGGEPDDDWASGEPPDGPEPDWPDDWPDDDQAGAPGMTPAPDGGNGGARPGRRPLALAVVAVVALAAGAGVALVVGQGHAPVPSAAASRPPATAPGGSSGGSVLPGAGGGSAATRMFVGGQVLAVSGTSITIGGPARSVTAAVTSSTRVTGRVSSIRGVKVGDLITAQMTESGARAAVTAIQDPGSLPAGGSLP